MTTRIQVVVEVVWRGNRSVRGHRSKDPITMTVSKRTAIQRHYFIDQLNSRSKSPKPSEQELA